MADEFKAGDQVEWDSPQGKVEGEVVRKLTEESHIGGHTFKATPEEPEFEVKSDKTGKHAVHKPDALKKRS